MVITLTGVQFPNGPRLSGMKKCSSRGLKTPKKISPCKSQSTILVILGQHKLLPGSHFPGWLIGTGMLEMATSFSLSLEQT